MYLTCLAYKRLGCRTRFVVPLSSKCTIIGHLTALLAEAVWRTINPVGKLRLCSVHPMKYITTKDWHKSKSKKTKTKNNQDQIKQSLPCLIVLPYLIQVLIQTPCFYRLVRHEARRLNGALINQSINQSIN